MAATGPSYYELLGVASDATPNQLREAYYAHAKKLHPDRNQSDPEAIEKFKQIRLAYDTLRDGESRKRYDLWGTTETIAVPETSTRIKLWGFSIASYLVLNLISSYTGIALEWIISLILHGTLIYRNKSLTKLDFGIFVIAIIINRILPIKATLLIARIFWAIIISIAPNVTTIEWDVSIIMLSLSLFYELFWRSTVSMYFTLLAAYSIPVNALFIFIAIGACIETKIPDTPSFLASSWNVNGFYVGLLMLVAMFIDYLASLIVPTSLLSWTFPVTWWIPVIMLVLVVLSHYGGQNRTGIVVVSTVFILGFLISYYLLPTHWSLYIISICSHLTFASVIRALEIQVRVKNRESPGSVFYYWIFTAIITFIDVYYGHYKLLGAQSWTIFSALLVGISLNMIFWSLQSLIFTDLSIAFDDEAENTQEQSEEKSDTSKNAEENKN